MANASTIAGRRVFITGGARGIGAATARAIVESGGRVALYDLDGEAVSATARALGPECAIGLAGDVTDERTVETALGKTVEAFGGLDDLVNNAGTFDHAPLVELSRARWQRVLDVNLMAPILISSAAVRVMGRGGSVVNVSSVLGQVAAPGRGPYCLSKAALITLTKLQAIEWAERGIRVNAIAPGYILNEATRAFVEAGGVDIEAVRRRIPLGCLGEEEDVAAGICYLIDPVRAKYVTGHVLEVNGGWTAYGFL